MSNACIPGEAEVSEHRMEAESQEIDEDGIVSSLPKRSEMMEKAKRNQSAFFKNIDEEYAGRKGHLEQLLAKNDLRMKQQEKRISVVTAAAAVATLEAVDEEAGVDVEVDEKKPLLSESELKELEKEVEQEGVPKAYADAQETLASYGIPSLPSIMPRLSMEVRVKDLTFTVSVRKGQEIQTVYTISLIYSVVKFFQRLVRGDDPFGKQIGEKKVLQNMNLMLEPGKSYLVLGPPSSGKTTLLRAIAGLLKPRDGAVLEGTVSYNGRELNQKEEFYIENLMAYIDQIDQHAPRLTVFETFNFANNCMAKGKVMHDEHLDAKTREAMDKANKERVRPKLVASMLGLKEVQDTFVGDSFVRGISGGQRRRVTVGEMTQTGVSVMCGDEISTGRLSRTILLFYLPGLFLETLDGPDIYLHCQFTKTNEPRVLFSLPFPYTRQGWMLRLLTTWCNCLPMEHKLCAPPASFRFCSLVRKPSVCLTP